MKTNAIIKTNLQEIESKIRKHNSYLSDYLTKNNYSFSFSDGKLFNNEAKFFVSLTTNENWGGSCWNDEVYYEEYEFKKSKVINSLIYFLSIVVPCKKRKELKAIADIIFSDSTATEFFNGGYYNNFTKGLTYKFEFEKVVEEIKKYYSIN